MKYKKGDLVRIVVEGINVTPDGYATGTTLNNRLYVYDYIDVVSFPSFNDFHGEKILVKNNTVATIIEYVGRPFNIKKDPQWFSYDIYKVLIDGKVKQIFCHNIKKYKKNRLP